MNQLTQKAICCGSTLAVEHDNPDKYWDTAQLYQVPAFRESPYPESKVQGLRDILVTSAEFQGQPAEFFAYIGIPSGPVPVGGFPGIVMVHGAIGTAIPQYVKLWVQQGFVVVALDWYNQRPKLNGEDLVGYLQLPGGQRQEHVINVANMVLSHSLLRSLPEVNPERTAFVGLSWGSWYGDAVAAVDDRFKGAVEIYCGGVKTTGEQAMLGKFLHRARIPMYWVAGCMDSSITPNELQAGFNECGKFYNKSLVATLPHSHIGFSFPAAMRMAKHFVGAEENLPLLGDLTIIGNTATCQVLSAGKGIKRSVLVYTTDRTEETPHKRNWKTTPAQLDGQQITATLPDDVFQCFLSAYDDESPFDDLCGSTNILEFTTM